jgi:hypothetical protein
MKQSLFIARTILNSQEDFVCGKKSEFQCYKACGTYSNHGAVGTPLQTRVNPIENTLLMTEGGGIGTASRGSAQPVIVAVSRLVTT